MSKPISGHVRRPAPRELVHGAFVLGAPGTYIRHSPDCLIVGNQPGLFHYVVVAICGPIAILIVWLLWPYQPAIALIFLALFGVVPLLILWNRQRYEIRLGRVAARGRALGLRQDRDWLLPAESAVRISSHWEPSSEATASWPVYQAQILTAEGWLGIAESALRDRAEAFAQQLAAAAGIRPADEETVAVLDAATGETGGASPS